MSEYDGEYLSREEMIRTARANCIQQIEHPRDSKERSYGDEATVTAPFEKGTYIRLFLAGLLFLGAFLLKRYDTSIGVINPQSVRSVIESGADFEELQKESGKLLQEKIIPLCSRLLD